MRNRRINVRKFLIIVLCCSVFLTGCFIHLPEPLGKDEIVAWFRENRVDITLVTKVLLRLEYDSCCVWDASSPVTYLGNEVPIDDGDFYPAAKRLFKTGCFRISKREGDTVDYVMENRFDGVFIGLAYSPDYKVPTGHSH